MDCSTKFDLGSWLCDVDDPREPKTDLLMDVLMDSSNPQSEKRKAEDCSSYQAEKKVKSTATLPTPVRVPQRASQTQSDMICCCCKQPAPNRTSIFSVLADFDKSDMAKQGIRLKLMKKQSNLANRISAHSERMIRAMIHHMGGDLAVFKIGVASHGKVAYRFEKYQEANFLAMWIIHISDCVGEANMLEHLLIEKFWDRMGCRNDNAGGEGQMRTQGDPPYYVYVVAARADVNKRIGS